MKKKYFNYFIILMMFTLIFLVYQQWFGPSAPVEYYAPLESAAPRHLESLAVKDFEGNSIKINVQDFPKTLIVMQRVPKNYDPNLDVYKLLSSSFLYKRLNSMGIRTVHIWVVSNKNEVEVVKEKYSPTEIDSKYYIDLRTLIAYRDLGFKLSGIMSAATYNNQGDLIYERKSSSISSVLADEIFKGVNIR